MTFSQTRSAYLVRAAIILFLGGCGGDGDVKMYVAPSTSEVTIFDNNNVFAVFNTPTAPTVFSITNSYKITLITNYHWNNAAGQPGGTIMLTSAGGQAYGPWSVTTRSGQGGVPNAYWDAAPNVVIPSGAYTVGDSNPATWSQNTQSNGQGISVIKGIQQ